MTSKRKTSALSDAAFHSSSSSLTVDSLSLFLYSADDLNLVHQELMWDALTPRHSGLDILAGCDVESPGDASGKDSFIECMRWH